MNNLYRPSIELTANKLFAVLHYARCLSITTEMELLFLVERVTDSEIFNLPSENPIKNGEVRN